MSDASRPARGRQPAHVSQPASEPAHRGAAAGSPADASPPGSRPISARMIVGAHTLILDRGMNSPQVRAESYAVELTPAGIELGERIA